MTPEQLRPTLKQRRQSKTDGLADSVVTSLSPKNKDGRKALLKASKDMPVFDEQWELHMKTQISQDFHLLMQVLRFEVQSLELQIRGSLCCSDTACAFQCFSGISNALCSL